MTEIFTYVTSSGETKYRIKQYDVFDSFTLDNFSTIEFLDWVHTLETSMKDNPDWSYEFEAGGGHSDMSCYLTVHRSKEATEFQWKAHMIQHEKKSKDIRRQEYLRLKKEFENEE